MHLLTTPFLTPCRQLSTCFWTAITAVVMVGFAIAPQAHAQTFSNPDPITIPLVGTATPYPSSLLVSGMTGTNNVISVTLDGFSHTFPADVDVLLVSPAGISVALMFGAGGDTAVGDVSITFSDTSILPVSFGPLTSGTFRPANYSPSDVLSAPAPASPYGETLSAFDELDPNGEWKLFVEDFEDADGGEITRGWSMTFSAVAPEPSSLLLLLSGASVLLMGIMFRIRLTDSRKAPADRPKRRMERRVIPR